MAAKTLTQIRLIARTHSLTALATLVGIMRSGTAPPAARIAAANSLLDRAWGKPTQPIAGDDENPLQVKVTEIVRTIVDPEEVKRERAARRAGCAREGDPEGCSTH